MSKIKILMIACCFVGNIAASSIDARKYRLDSALANARAYALAHLDSVTWSNQMEELYNQFQENNFIVTYEQYEAIRNDLFAITQAQAHAANAMSMCSDYINEHSNS